MSATDDLTILGSTVREARRELQSFPAPPNVTEVEFVSHELTSLCPVTGQPDHGSLTLRYRPSASCIESKSWKLYLWSFRDEAHFVEQLAHRVAHDVVAAVEPEWVEVVVRQNVRGGIETTATAELGERFPMIELEALIDTTVEVDVDDAHEAQVDQARVDAITGRSAR